MKAMLKAPGIKYLNLKHDEPLPIFAFNCNLRRYTSGHPGLPPPPGQGWTYGTDNSPTNSFAANLGRAGVG